MSIVSDILESMDEILGNIDEIGAVKHPVFLLTRKWSDEKGVGSPVDTIEQMLPTPFIKDYSQDLRVREGGSIRQGDIILKMISKQKYNSESMIDCSVPDKKTEKWYKINDRLYEVISVTEDYVYWNVHIRKTIKKT